MTANVNDRFFRPLLTALGAALVIAAAASAFAAPPAEGADERAKFDRDRAAILAMAGEYRVKFQFVETVPLRKGYALKAPYTSDATEFVDVVEDAGDRIVLQHVLVVEDDDAAGGRRVVKHWRQDWEYENTRLYEFRGHNTWAPRDLSAAEAEGTWTQRVFQVDDSPRYQGFARWIHDGNVSSWESEPTWRPLPRREYTKRSDYHVLVAVNRHTLTPTGWVHEQDNHKLVLDDAGRPAGDQPILAREAGLNVYDRVTDVDFAEGRDYWTRTAPFWADVRAAWDGLFATGRPITLARKVDDKPLWKHMFEQAEASCADGYDPAEGRAAIASILDRFVQNDATASASRY